MLILLTKAPVPFNFYKLFLVGIGSQIWSQSCCGLQFVVVVSYNLVVVDNFFGFYNEHNHFNL